MARQKFVRTLSACSLALNVANLLWRAGIIDHGQFVQTMLLATYMADGSIQVDAGIRSMVRVWSSEGEESTALT